MAKSKKHPPCLRCNGSTEKFSMTLARAVTGDLVFCGFRCLTRWEQDRARSQG